MDNIIDPNKFESMLKDRVTKRVNQIYDVAPESRSSNEPKPQEIIAGLTKQLKVIHKSETIRQPRKANFIAKKSLNADFININMLSQDEQMSPDSKVASNKFETQCFSDTQLINVVEKAEAVNVEAGFTQEFDTSFQGHQDCNDQNIVEIDEPRKVDNIDEEFTTQKDEFHSLNTSLEITNENELNNKTQDATDISMIPNINETSDYFEQVDDVEMSCSPVFQCSMHPYRNSKPLIFNLESFEKFESIAVPVIDEHLDKSVTKRIINSQMVDKELFLNIHIEPFLFERDKLKSPIINKEKNEILLKNGTNTGEKDTSEFKDLEKHAFDKRSDSLKDEILFSSDEEEDYAHKNMEDLSFTCALENPYLDEPENLDQTMYVGFQTASDKAIQICSNSFKKAKNLFSDVDTNVNENNSFTELVDKHDSLNKSPILSQDPNVKNDLNVSKVIFNECCDNNVKSLDNKPLEGFKTASNKVIKMSKKALSRCLKVFKDINLDEQFDTIKSTDKSSKDLLVEQEDLFSDDDFNISKIEDDCLLQEFENVDMSHNENNALIDIEMTNSTDSAITLPLERDTEIFEERVLSKEVNKTDEFKSEEKLVIPEFQGFKTASNKLISVSNEALATSKKLFEDLPPFEDTETMFKKPAPVSVANTCLKGFQTANNKLIKIPQKSSEVSKKVFEGLEKLEIGDIQCCDEMKNVTSFKGFQTASKKPVIISKKALEKSKKLFEYLDGHDNIQDSYFNPTNQSTEAQVKTSSFEFFPTGYSEQVSESNVALEKEIENYVGMNKIQNNTLMQSLDKNKPMKTFSNHIESSKYSTETSEKAVEPQNDHHFLPTNENDVAKQQTPKFLGFQTASKKKVEKSKSALARSMKIFQDIDKLDPIEVRNFDKGHKRLEDVDNESNTNEIHEQKSQIHVCESISNNGTVSEKVFTETPNNTKDIIDDEKYNKPKPFRGFTTATNKDVVVSEKAIFESRKIFQDILTYETSNKNREKESPLESPHRMNEGNEMITKSDFGFQGFQTASNKEINVSEAALKKSKLLLDLESNSVHDKDQVVSTSFKGFQTASNKKVEVSAQALEKSKSLFDNIDTDLEKNIKPSGFTFQTANKQQVAVSEDSLSKIRNSQANMSGVKLAETLQSDVKINVGAKTVNKRNLKILKEALNKSRVLQDNNCDIDKGRTKTIIENVTSQDPKIDDIENIIDTQVLDNFEGTLSTKAFCEKTTPVSKRSGSPILSCPKAKRRKIFQTPYSKNIRKVKPINIVKPTIQPESKLTFAVDYKKTKRLTLTDINKLEINSINTAEDPFLLQHEYKSLHNFEFIGNRNDLTDAKTITAVGVERIFLDNVDSKIIPDGWIKNHIRLIIWKLISYEVKFPKTLSLVCTARNVLNQLKYRYDKELYKAERPALRKILEKDDIPSKTLVLCVVAVYVDGVSVTSVPPSYTTIELELTDGWYTVMATIDKVLSELTVANKIKVGCKLVTNGAELLNCEQGVAPWENTSAVRLKLFGNSTRRARWHARLGYHSSGAILTQLSTVKPEGGKVSKIRVFVARVYPTLYVEKFKDGSTVTRSERLENVHQAKYENERQALMEKAYEEVEKEFSDQTESQDSDVTIGSNKRKMETGSQIAKFMKKCDDPAEFRSHLSDSQVKLLQEHTTKRREKLLQDIQTRLLEKINRDGVEMKRNVVSLLKIRIVGLEDRNGEVFVSKATMSIWKPNDAILEIVTEGFWIEVLNVVPTSVRYSEIQISAGRQSIFKKSTYKIPEKLIPHIKLLQRTCYNIKDILQNPSMNTDYNEVDTIGMIFLIEPSIKQFDPTKQSFQNIYLTDADKNLLCVNFWGGIKKFGYENLLHTGRVVACFNLQKRAGNSRKTIPQYRVTEFTYFTKTPKDSVAKKMVDVLENKFLGVDICKFSDDCVDLKNNYAVLKSNYTDNVSPYRFNNSDYNISRNKVFIDSPLTTKVHKNDDFNLTGLDFESTFKQETQDLSPNMLIRKKKVMEKIERLKRYGEPPPISPITMINKTKNATSAYRSPLLLKSDSFGVASEKESELPNHTPKSAMTETNNETSPILKLNRTYIKYVNPIRLNFDNSVAMKENDTSIEHFAEDFESSPPLSLD